MDYNLTYVRLLVDNYRDSVRFYRDTLGLTLLRGDLESRYCEFDTSGIRLALFQGEDMAKALGMDEPKGEGRRHVALAFEVADVDATFKKLEGQGVKFVLAPRSHVDWNIRTAHLLDPDGNLIEINQRLS